MTEVTAILVYETDKQEKPNIGGGFCPNLLSIGSECTARKWTADLASLFVWSKRLGCRRRTAWIAISCVRLIRRCVTDEFVTSSSMATTVREIAFKVLYSRWSVSRLSEMTLLERPYTTSCWQTVETTPLSCTISETQPLLYRRWLQPATFNSSSECMVTTVKFIGDLTFSTHQLVHIL